jgi:hypothetical protein
MHNGAVADADVVGDFERCILGRVNDGAILYVYAVTDANWGDVTAHHHVVHDSDLVAKYDVTSNEGGRGDEGVVTQNRSR